MSTGKAPTNAGRLRRASRAFTTRRVPRAEIGALIRGDIEPRAGDLALVRVEGIGQHTRLHLTDGRRKHLFVGDELIVSYANRYAPRQFEAIVPSRLEPCHLVAAGGIAAKALSWHARIVRGPTEITPIGLLADRAGRRLNLADWALPPGALIESPGPITIAVVGTTMHVGKSTSAACLVNGLTRGGTRTGFAKVTGTGAAGDPGLLTDAGARPVLDFTDAGFASTYRVSHAEVEGILVTLVSHLRKAGLDAIVLELADGPFQQETADLLSSPVFASLTDGVIFCAPDAMGAAAGVELLRRKGLSVMAVGGVLTASPLQRREALAATGLPVLGKRDLADPATARKLLAEARERKALA